jgi:hypothetical protein
MLFLLSSRGFLRLMGLGIAVLSAAQILLLTRAAKTATSDGDNDVSSSAHHTNHHQVENAAAIVATAKEDNEQKIILINNNIIINIDNINDNEKSNRTLVVLMGNLRGGENAWSTLYEHVLDVNHADLALLIGDTPQQYVNATLFRRAKYIWTFQERDDWADAVDEVYGGNNNNNNNNATNASSWRSRLLPLAHENGEMLGGIQAGHDGQYNFRGSGLLIYMFRWYLTLHIQRLDLLQRYDRFIVTRADHYYKCHHNISLLDVANFIYVPKGQNYHGITDRHFVASRRDILPALSILPPILDYPQRYRDLLSEKNTNPERVIARRWQEEGLLQRLMRFDRVMFTCGQAGDPTRHKTLSIAVQPENVQLKYEREYVASYKSCGLYMPKNRSKQILSNLSSLCGGGAICTAQ